MKLQKIKLEEATRTIEEPVIYLDETNGLYYSWDGEKFVPYKTQSKPEFGKRGDKDTESREAEERKKQIEKDRQEHPGYEDEEPSSEDRVKEIKAKLNDKNFKSDLQSDILKAKERDTKRQKELARKAAEAEGAGKYGGPSKFKIDLSKLIKDEVGEYEETSWSRVNRRYVSTPFKVAGRAMYENPNVPTLNVYFDHSGSWGEDKIRDGKSIIQSVTKDYVKKGSLILNVYYFGGNHEVSTDPNAVGGSTPVRPVFEHIRKYRPNNVVIMTDSDFDGQWDVNYSVKVDGGVFLLFKGGVSTKLQENIKGRRMTKSYMM